MNTGELLRGLSQAVGAYLKAGGIVPGAGGNVGDLVTVMTGAAFGEFRTVLNDFVSQLRPSKDLPEAVAELTRKRDAIRAGRPLRELTDDELVAYSALGDMRHILTAEHVVVTMSHASLEDFLRVVVPVVKELAPIILTMVL